jgi:hypothetical protein
MEEDRDLQLHGVYNAVVDAYDASIIKAIKKLLKKIQEDDELETPLSNFLRQNLVKLFGDTLVDPDAGLKHRREWARRKPSDQVLYVLDLIECLQNDPSDGDLVTPAERQALKTLEEAQDWSGKKGKAAIPS